MVSDVSATDAPGTRQAEDGVGMPASRDPDAAFFRDPELFTYLREQVLPEIIAEARQRDNEIRLWSAGCATGEEAYSLAILVAEALGDDLDRYTVRIFATDPDTEALTFARRGAYTAVAVRNVPAPLRDRYFTPSSAGYAVMKRVRDLVIFGWHDLMQRPPFSRIDMVLYCDILSGEKTAARRRAAARLFAHALREGGYLAFGGAALPEPMGEYFTVANDALYLYRRHGDRPPPIVPHRLGGRVDAPEPPAPPRDARSAAARYAADDVLLYLPAGVVVVDRRYDIQSINGLARRLFGIHGAALGEDFIHLLHGVSPQPLHAAIDAALRDGQTHTLDAAPTQAVAPGETHYLRITCAAPENSADDAPGVVVIAAVDVTDTVREQQERGRSDAGQQAEVERLTGLVEQLSAANNELLAANEQLARDNTVLHRSNDAYQGAVEEARVAAEEIETLNEELQASNEELQATDDELEALNAELQITNAELARTNAELEQRNGEMQELAVRREEQRRRLAAILSSMSESVVVLDRDGQTVFTSASFHRMFGAGGATFAPADTEGRLLPAESTPQWRAARGESFQMEFTLLGPDEQRHWYEATARPVRAGEGDDESRDSVLVIRDITDRSLRYLQDQFLALASHELRTPLTPVRGYLEMLVKGLGAASETGRMAGYARSALDQSRRLQVLVNDLLDVTRLQSGKLKLAREPVDLAAVVTQAVENMRVAACQDSAGERDADEALVEVKGADEPLMVDGDATRLEQIVMNLLTNAAKYAPASPVDVSLRRVGGEVELQVQDNGRGIAPEDQQRIFSRFYQVERHESGSPGGLGLGLYITRELVQAHGGRIDVQSAPRAGATFTVRLPLLET